MIRLKSDGTWVSVHSPDPQVHIMIRDVLRYHPDGYEHQYKYKYGSWDGYNYLYNLTDARFRAGLLPRVQELLAGVPYTLEEEPHPDDTLIDVELNDVGIKPFDYQYDAAKAMLNHERGLIVAPTGSGKTFIISLGLSLLKRRAMVIVTDVVLLDQMQQSLSRFLNTEIGMIGDGEFEIKNITVTTIQSLRAILQGKSIKNADRRKILLNSMLDTGVVISDEAHLADSNTFDDIMPQFVNTRRFYGLSATPYGWADKAEKKSNIVLEQHYGDVVYDARKINMVQIGIKVPLLVDYHSMGFVNAKYEEHYKRGPGGKKSPDHGKNYRQCFTWRTVINTENGPMHIGHVANMWLRGEQTPKVLSYDETSDTFVYKQVTGALRQRPTDLVRVKAGNVSVTCTSSHELLTTDGWKHAVDITAGDKIISTRDDSSRQQSAARPNSDQLQIMIGSYLGDGSFRKTSNGYVLRETHGLKQRDYCTWKGAMLGAETRNIKSGNGVQFRTRAIAMPGHIGCPKVDVPAWMIDLIDWRGIAIWFMDDGCAYRHPSKKNIQRYFISTNCFSAKSVDMLVDKLNSIGVTCSRQDLNVKRGKQSIINIHRAGYATLCANISQYVHKDCHYKLDRVPSHEYNWDTKYSTSSLVTVKSVSAFTPRQSDHSDAFHDVYDLRIEDTHTYVVYGTSKTSKIGIVAHNCLETELLFNHDYKAKVAELAWEEMAHGRSVFVHAGHSLEFGEELNTMIPGSVFVSGSTTRKQRREVYDAMRSKSRLIMVSDVGGTGLDLPSLDTIVLASDLKDVRQLAGRVLRTDGKKKFGKVVDIAKDCQFLAKHAKIRKHQYKDQGATLHTEDDNE